MGLGKESQHAPSNRGQKIGSYHLPPNGHAPQPGHLFETLSTRYQSRTGGYLRIVKVGNRPGDGAPVSLVELIGEGKEAAKKAKGKKKREKVKRSQRTKLPEAPAKP
jgi:hypothetical protein